MVTKYKAITKNILYVHFYEELTDGENLYKAIFRAMQTSSSSVRVKTEHIMAEIYLFIWIWTDT
jgi:hypothetical protein